MYSFLLSAVVDIPSHPFSFSNMIDISDYNIYVVANNDVIMTSLIVYSLKKRHANNVCLLVPTTPNEVNNISFFFFFFFFLFFFLLIFNLFVSISSKI
jgi:hypothetical protein